MYSDTELFYALLAHALQTGQIQITCSAAEGSIFDILQSKCYQTLEKIKAIVQDDSIEDEECFQRVEQIVCALEEIGSNGGFRHDFG